MSAMPDFIDAARDFVPLLKERAPEIEQARQLPQDLAAAFQRAGFYSMLVPKTYHGAELDLPAYIQVIQTLAQGDGSAAWCVMIGSTSGILSAYMPEGAARELFTETSDTIVAGVFAPRGKAVAAAGGYQINGEWQWGSGSPNAAWIAGGCMMIKDGEIERMSNGMPLSRMMLMPAADVELLDTWHVSGLCGTGSTDFRARDVFVPKGRGVSLVADTPLARPLYRFPVFALLAAGVASVALGVGRAALDELVAFAGVKTPEGAAKPLAGRQDTQIKVCEAEAGLRSASSWLREVVEAAWEDATTKGEIGLDQRRDMRVAFVHATRAAAGAADIAYNLGGGTSVYRRSALQRCFRDVHVATQHMMVGTPVLEQAGRLFLGLKTDVSTF